MEDRPTRDRASRAQFIVTTARELAEAEGWPAVTTRRLSGVLGFSQPVLYGHFPTMRAIMAATAMEGFAELAVALRRPRRGASDVGRVARLYLDFAAAHPALYEAMFTSAEGLAFGTAEAQAPLIDAFTPIREVVGDDETLAEVLWATLHGLVTLDATGRLRPSKRAARLRAVTQRFGASA